jgi:PKHD-type hydroxylase
VPTKNLVGTHLYQEEEMQVFTVLTPEEVKELRKKISEKAWVDGKRSARGAAKDKKENLQINANDPVFKEHFAPVVNKVHTNNSVAAYTFIKEVVDPRLASYRTMGKYDWHVDTALLSHRRTDLSWTLFLSDPSEYEGGEMEIKMGQYNAKVKCQAGQMVVYPSGLLHKVNSVSSGDRTVIVGWINSHIKIHEHRERLYKYFMELVALRKELGSERVEAFNTLYHQFVRDYCG